MLYFDFKNSSQYLVLILQDVNVEMYFKPATKIYYFEEKILNLLTNKNNPHEHEHDSAPEYFFKSQRD